MKAWTLIAFYLWKDIWSRWLEMPGAVLARLLVASLLAGLLFLAQAAFMLAGRSLEQRISRMGAQTLFVSELVTPDAGQGLASLDRLLAPLRGRADVLSFMQVPALARDDFGTDYQLLLYGPETLTAIGGLLAADPAAPAHVLTGRLPAGIRIPVTVEGIELTAAVVPSPAWIGRLPSSRPLLLMPAQSAPNRLLFGHQELALVVGGEATAEAVRPLGQALRSLLRLEHRDQALVQSPEDLLDELDELRAARGRWQTGAGLAGGLVVALVFGSIAILEYRQNRYIAALLRSFGVPAGLLLVRYLIEALLLVSTAILLARFAAGAGHAWLFAKVGFEAGLLDRARLDPYAWSELTGAVRWLLAGAVLSVLPVLSGLRQPVGRILQ